MCLNVYKLVSFGTKILDLKIKWILTITDNYNINSIKHVHLNEPKVSWKSLGQGNKPTIRVKYGITLLVPINSKTWASQVVCLLITNF